MGWRRRKAGVQTTANHVEGNPCPSRTGICDLYPKSESPISSPSTPHHQVYGYCFGASFLLLPELIAFLFSLPPQPPTGVASHYSISPFPAYWPSSSLFFHLKQTPPLCLFLVHSKKAAHLCIHSRPSEIHIHTGLPRKLNTSLVLAGPRPSRSNLSTVSIETTSVISSPLGESRNYVVRVRRVQPRVRLADTSTPCIKCVFSADAAFAMGNWKPLLFGRLVLHKSAPDCVKSFISGTSLLGKFVNGEYAPCWIFPQRNFPIGGRCMHVRR